MGTYGATLPKGADIPLAAQRGGYDWHLFSYNVVYALCGADATQEYINLDDSAFIVLPHAADKTPGCRCTCKSIPRLDGAHDVHISAPNLSWTMVFTREDGWCGPYSSCAKWVRNPPKPQAPEAPEQPSKKQRRRRRR